MPFILALVLSVLVSLGIVKIVIMDVDYFHIIFGFNVFSISPPCTMESLEIGSHMKD